MSKEPWPRKALPKKALPTKGAEQGGTARNLFATFLGNGPIVAAISRMLAENRLPQTLLFAGPEGVGKATLARLLAAAINCKNRDIDFSATPCGACPACRRILEADLSLPEYRKLFEERLRLPAEKRRDTPLVISTHPDFLTFPPDGPLAQISIEQVRTLKEHAQFAPAESRGRLFLVDHADRIDFAAANSLLKVLEEPPPYLTLVLTAENAYDLLPTIQSRCVPFYFAPLSVGEMERFFAGREEIAPSDRTRLRAWAQGRPGRALGIDVADYEKRRQGVLALLRAGAGAPFGEVIRHTEAIGRGKQERLEWQLDSLYGLLQDLLHLKLGAGSLINEDVRGELAALAGQIDFHWLNRAIEHVDALDALARRNIQKQIALEALALNLRPS